MASTSAQASTLITLDCLRRISLAADGLSEVIGRGAPRDSPDTNHSVDRTFIDDLAAIADEFELLLTSLRSTNLY